MIKSNEIKKDTNQKVWFFNRPIIGYCSKCKCIATWNNVYGLHCPICLKPESELSIFKFDKYSKYPE